MAQLIVTIVMPNVRAEDLRAIQEHVRLHAEMAAEQAWNDIYAEERERKVTAETKPLRGE
jgi:hypothetical protein